MNSIFDKTSNEAMLARINKLTVENKPLWGKMDAAQMCKHCTLAIDVAFGKMNLKLNFAMRLLGKILKKKVLYGGEMKKNSPTAKEFIVTDTLELEVTKTALLNNFSRLASEGKSAIKVMDHPFWGKMTFEDWDALLWKHTDHHLKQFGV
jgi:hypothetical protein